MKTELLEILENTNAKNVSTIVKNKPYFNEINNCYGTTISEKIYNYLYPDQHTCDNGNKKKFVSVKEGYGFCGRASTCECARISVSQNVSKTKQSYTDDMKSQIQKKRINTTLEKYGVTNVGQTNKAKINHSKFYSDNELVQQSIVKSKATNKERHGNENYRNSDKIKETLKNTFTVDYKVDRFNNKNYRILCSKENFEELYSMLPNPVELADILKVNVKTVYRYLEEYGLRAKYKSIVETEIVMFLQSLGITNIIRNTRKLLPSGKEIDIYLPDHKIAIEYNVIYYHHDKLSHITKDYHKNKFFECEELGIQLLTVFSSSWNSKKLIVKRMIKNVLGLNSESVYARKCVIKEIDNKTTKDFLTLYHIQGYVPAQYRYGLYYNNELVCLMTFGKTRMCIGSKKDTGYELIRFASSTRVVGGASKLLKAFIERVKPDKITSYSSNEYSFGNLYKQLGFTLESEVPESYWYIVPGKRDQLLHRSNFTKFKLVNAGYDKTLTEREITENLGFLRVWDCGKRKWVMYIKWKKGA